MLLFQELLLSGHPHCTRVTIWTARPGIVIGRKGQELDS